MRVWIIDEYAGSRYHGMTYRCYYMAKEFVKMGIDTTIIAGAYSHVRSKNPQINKEKYTIEFIDKIKYCWVKTLKYKNSFDKKRVFKWFLFIYRLFGIKAFLKDKPDVIICTTPGISFLGAYYLSKKLKCKLVFEVKDIWPLTLIEIGNISKNHPFIIFMSIVEKFAIKKCDYLVSNLPNYDLYLKDNNIKKSSHWISNGIDLDEMKKIEPLDDSIIQKIPQDKFIIGYTGTIGEANAIEDFLESMKFLDDRFVFILVGNGKNKEKLQLKYQEYKNIIFLDYIKKTQIQSMLSLFDVCYIGWKKVNLYKYGISATKLYDYMYSQKPIIHSFDGNYDIVKLANCGISTNSQDSKYISKCIKKLFDMDIKQREKLGQNGKQHVLENFSYDFLAKKYIKVLKDNS